MKAESETSDIVYVKVRIERGLHEKLKKVAQNEKRSMNYLMNKSVEVLLSIKNREF
jgi:predicted HicB family RNase H-like nuclease